MNVHDRVAIVTGAGGALGRATAVRLAADGCALSLTDVDAGTLDDTAKEVRAAGGTCITTVADLADATAISDLFARTDELGSLSVAVNNAAVYPTRAFVDVPIEEHDRILAVNERGYWLVAQHAARRMIPRSAGSIVNVASITFHGGWADLAGYVTTKGAAIGLTRALARELGVSGIRVNAVAPGAFPTAAETIHPDPEAYDEFVIQHQAIKRRGSPAELAAVVAFLAGPDASFVTGQTIEVNGGWVMT